ncbi:L,D-transpeptidase family protein [Nitrosomonas sp.]|uniref:L,D-transpeptidase family protein n=1 Tax=Nitrosomonas sp. TaxID=42353 RepID=UPI00284A35F5|nr:L,D-transpeptidase family protein [Nitrosomonas sp.]MDR4515577.1 L,D-transpeptidase family protein [Nitrosomonas sp.]
MVKINLRLMRNRWYGIVWLFGILLLNGCQSFLSRSVDEPVSAANTIPIPVASHQFSFDPFRDDVVGSIQVVTARYEDTLSDIARRFNLGYEEIVAANPDVDPWLPGVGTRIIIPTQFVLPAGPREGVVINLAAMRLFYFPKVEDGELQKVITHPVGIGRLQWKTPEGITRITVKDENPVWRPTPSIHKEYARNGNPLPAAVPPGPDNPMGTHVLRLAWPTYAIHGTNKPPSIGLRGSFGCIRMYPEDIVGLFNDVAVGTPVRVVNQPRLLGWRDNRLYIQTYPVLEDDKRNHDKLFARLMKETRSALKAQINARPHQQLNEPLLNELILNPRSTAVPVTDTDILLQAYLGQAQHVQNTLPFNATWAGDFNENYTTAEIQESGQVQ